MKVTRAELARKLNLSRARITRMVQEGIITIDRTGRIDLKQAMESYYASVDPTRGGRRPRNDLLDA